LIVVAKKELGGEAGEAPPAKPKEADHTPIVDVSSAKSAPAGNVAEKPLPPKKSKQDTVPAGMVLCKVHTGWYQLDNQLLGVGAEVLVPADEVEKLAHCLSPVEG
jgi:hypothetical protein